MRDLNRVEKEPELLGVPQRLASRGVPFGFDDVVGKHVAHGAGSLALVGGEHIVKFEHSR